MLNRNRCYEEEPIFDESVQAQDSLNQTIKIVAGEDGKLKILMNEITALSPMKAEQMIPEHDFATPIEVINSNTPSAPASEKKSKKSKKRPLAEASTAETTTTNSQGNIQKTVKKPKYERKSRVGVTYDSDFGWGMLCYQPNMTLLQAKLGQELPPSDHFIIPYVANAYAFNDNLAIIRSKLRKDRISQFHKKALARLPFNQNQNFQSITYKPGTSFITNQNKITIKPPIIQTQFSNKPQNPINPLLPKPLEPTISKPDGIQIPDSEFKKPNPPDISLINHTLLPNMPAPSIMINEEQKQPLTSADPNAKFTCAGCLRSDTKKYAKNLCQTCYKKQRRAQDDSCVDNANLPKSEPNMQPQITPVQHQQQKIATPQNPIDESLVLREWTGTCPDCKRTDVKHYAKGKCTNCYRKYRKKINASKGLSESVSMDIPEVLTTSNQP